VTIVKRHLLDRVPISTLAKDYEIDPVEVNLWVQQVMDAAETMLTQSPQAQPEANPLERKLQMMETRLKQVNTILSELRENVEQLRRESGQYQPSSSQQYILESSGPPPRAK
jgi:transposase